MFADADLTDDAFLGGRVKLWQPAHGYRAGTDPVLLAAACPAVAGQSVLDMGCGAGAAVLCLAARVPGLTLAGLEVQPDYADLAQRNAARNGVALAVAMGDLRAMPQALRHDFDHVITNPPYYPAGGTPSPHVGRATAMQVDAVPLADWMRACARRLRPGGWLTLIAGADALPALLSGLGTLGSAVVLPLAARPNRPAGRILLRARKGGRGAFRLLAPFVLHDGPAHDGDRESHSTAANAVLRDGCDLSALIG